MNVKVIPRPDGWVPYVLNDCLPSALAVWQGLSYWEARAMSYRIFKPGRTGGFHVGSYKSGIAYEFQDPVTKRKFKSRYFSVKTGNFEFNGVHGIKDGIISIFNDSLGGGHAIYFHGDALCVFPDETNLIETYMKQGHYFKADYVITITQ
jgi:hypothetical protein